MIPSGGPVLLGIAAVERETGLSKDLLRVWERRYGFPSPSRDAFGERAYPADQVDRLHLLRRLLDAGHRPGRVVPLPAERLRALLEAPAPVPVGRARVVRRTRAAAGVAGVAGLAEHGDDRMLRPLVDHLRANRVDALQQGLRQAIVGMGLERFVLDLCVPLTRRVGDEWARGALAIYQEHQYSELLQSLLRAEIARVPRAGLAPQIVLATLPMEGHGLGLLMAEALLVLEGCACLPLGTRLPAREIAAAAAACRADVVAVSCSAAPAATQVTSALTELHAVLPRGTALWVGGSHPVLQRRPPPATVVVASLGEIRGLVGAWRAAADGVPDAPTGDALQGA